MSYLNNQPMAKADAAHLRNMKYVKNWDFLMVNPDSLSHQAHILADSNNVCQSPCRNVSTHAKGLWGLASHQIEADWSRKTEPTHAQSTVPRLAIFLFLFLLFSDLTFSLAPSPTQSLSLLFLKPILHNASREHFFTSQWGYIFPLFHKRPFIFSSLVKMQNGGILAKRTWGALWMVRVGWPF